MHFATNEVLRANFSVYASKKQGKLRKKIVRGMLMNYANVKVLYFDDDGTIPNHPRLPVLLYEHVFISKKAKVESIFNSHDWKNSWVGGIYDFHHYHSNSHEALGVISGSARLKLGGHMGENIVVHAGDVLVLPAGTGHMRLQSTADFKVVGAYPEGMEYNLRTGKQTDRPHVFDEIAQVPIPTTDPVYGDKGPLTEWWN
jgi:uncharacterized protein YjlB